MLSTFKHVGTKTPENVPSLSWPPIGLGPSPGFVRLSSPSGFLCSVWGSARVGDDFCPLVVVRFRSKGVVSVELELELEPFCIFKTRFVKLNGDENMPPLFDVPALGRSLLPEGPSAPNGFSCEGVASSTKTENRLFNSPAASTAVRVWNVGRVVVGWSVPVAIAPHFDDRVQMQIKTSNAATDRMGPELWKE